MRKLFCFKKFKFLGFTMAEAILVMTILGIIATIMITTMKPAQFKEKGYQILAKQTLADLDTALGMVLTNHCPYGTLDACYKSDSTEIFNLKAYTEGIEDKYLGQLLKKYLASSRSNVTDWVGNTYRSDRGFALKNGVNVFISRGFEGEIDTWIPGEKEATSMTFANPHYGMIQIDINGTEEPNTLGKDRFNIPLDKNGIMNGN